MLHKSRKLREIKASGFLFASEKFLKKCLKKGQMCTVCVPDFKKREKTALIGRIFFGLAEDSAAHKQRPGDAIQQRTNSMIQQHTNNGPETPVLPPVSASESLVDSFPVQDLRRPETRFFQKPRARGQRVFRRGRPDLTARPSVLR